MGLVDRGTLRLVIISPPRPSTGLPSEHAHLRGLLGRVSAFELVTTLCGTPAAPGQHRAPPGRRGRVQGKSLCLSDVDGKQPPRRIATPPVAEPPQPFVGLGSDGRRQIREVIPSVPSLIFLEAVDAHREILSRPPERPSRVRPVCMSLAQSATTRPTSKSRPFRADVPGVEGKPTLQVVQSPGSGHGGVNYDHAGTT